MQLQMLYWFQNEKISCDNTIYAMHMHDDVSLHLPPLLSSVFGKIFIFIFGPIWFHKKIMWPSPPPPYTHTHKKWVSQTLQKCVQHILCITLLPDQIIFNHLRFWRLDSFYFIISLLVTPHYQLYTLNF